MKKRIVCGISLIMSVILMFAVFLPCAAAAEVAEKSDTPTESASVTDSSQLAEKEENETEIEEKESSFFGMVSETIRMIIEWLANFDIKNIDGGTLSTISGMINRLLKLFLK